MTGISGGIGFRKAALGISGLVLLGAAFQEACVPDRPGMGSPGAGGSTAGSAGTTGAGGMLVGTVIGVLIIPGLYYLFGKLDGGRKLLKDETHSPLSEVFEYNAADVHNEHES